jgi:hypothetical protein
MIRLSDDQMQSILNAARGVRPSRREEFVDSVCLELVALEQIEKGNPNDENERRDC